MLISIGLLTKSVLRVQLLREQLIVLLVVLLDMRGDLLGVRFLQSVDGLIICFEFVKLLLVFLYASVEARFQLSHLTLEIGNFGLVCLLELLLLGEEPLLVLLELLEALVLLLHVQLLKAANLCLPGLALLRLDNLILLTGNHSVGIRQESFNLFFVGVLDGRLHGVVLLVLAVQVEDHLCELGDLL